MVPTCNRQSYALRFMRYWNGKGPTVILVDGSVKPIPREKLQAFDSKVIYLHKPSGIFARLRSAIDLVKTEYVAFAGDDEFFIPSAVVSCINTLEVDRSLVACMGRALGFHPLSSRIQGLHVYPKLRNYALLEDDPFVRTIRHLGDYIPSLIYAVTRVSVWRTVWRAVLEREFNANSVVELQIELAMSYAGKSRVIPELMWLRSFGENMPTRGTDPSMDTSKPFIGFWTDNNLKEDRALFISAMERLFYRLHPCEKRDCREAIVASFDAYLALYLSVRRERRQASFFPLAIARRLAQFCLPEVSKAFIRSCLRPKPHLIQVAYELRKQDVVVDFNALADIVDILIKFHDLEETQIR